MLSDRHADLYREVRRKTPLLAHVVVAVDHGARAVLVEADTGPAVAGLPVRRGRVPILRGVLDEQVIAGRLEAHVRAVVVAAAELGV
jgi:hypothetical protein